jgi:hypothetical protein
MNRTFIWIVAGLSAYFVGMLATFVSAQPYGDAYECSKTITQDCTTGGWEYDKAYTVQCCCGTGGVGDPGLLCPCVITRYTHDSFPGAYCYLNSCGSPTSNPCTIGPSLGNVYIPTK